jgi:hypothetical protein
MIHRFYVLDPIRNESDFFLKLDFPSGFSIDERTVSLGESQFINDDMEVLTLKEHSEKLPDFDKTYFPLISADLKNIFDDAGVSNIFYKPVILEEEDGEEFYQYFVPVIRPINCVAWNHSRYEDKGMGRKRITGEFYIDEKRVGNFPIFSIKDAVNDFWIITEKLKAVLDEAKMSGVAIVETAGYLESRDK